MKTRSSKLEAQNLLTWEEVDQSLRRMGEIEIAYNKINGEMTLKINEIKEEAAARANGIMAERAALEKAITVFCEQHKHEFIKARSVELTFGLVAYRVSKSIYIKSKSACVAALKVLGLTSYIKTMEEPDKEALDGLENIVLAKIGVTRKIEDKLRIEPDLEKLKRE